MIEFATNRSGGTGAEYVIARAPAEIRDRINAARARRGLPIVRPIPMTIDVPVDAPRGPSVYWDPASPHRPRGATGRGLEVRATTTRVLLVVSHGIAEARDTGLSLPEWIRRDAFGPAAQLNSEPGWCLRDGHQGAILTLAGPRLRSHDTPAGLVVEWLPDLGRSDHRAIVDRIAAGKRGCSAQFIIKERRTVPLPSPTSVVMRARLIHLAILGDRRPAYPGSIASLFRDCPTGEGELRRQLDRAVESARWFANRS